MKRARLMRMSNARLIESDPPTWVSITLGVISFLCTFFAGGLWAVSESGRGDLSAGLFTLCGICFLFALLTLHRDLRQCAEELLRRQDADYEVYRQSQIADDD